MPSPIFATSLTLSDHLELMHEAGYDVSGLREPWIDEQERAHASRCSAVVRRHPADAPHVQLDFCANCSLDGSVGSYWSGLERRILNAMQIDLRLRETTDLLDGVLDPDRTSFAAVEVGYAFAGYRDLLQHLHPQGAKTSISDALAGASKSAAEWTALHADLTATHKPADLYLLELLTRTAAEWEELQATRPAHRMFTRHRHYFETAPRADIAAATRGSAVLYLMNPGTYVNQARSPWQGLTPSRDLDALVCLAWERDELVSQEDALGDIHFLVDYDTTFPQPTHNDGALTVAVIAAPDDRAARIRAFEMTLAARSDDLEVPVADIYAGVLAAHA